MNRTRLQNILLSLLGVTLAACTGAKGFATAGLNGGTATNSNSGVNLGSTSNSGTQSPFGSVTPAAPQAPPQLTCRMISALANKTNGNAQVDCNTDEVMTSCITTTSPSGASHCFNNAVPQGQNTGERPAGRSCVAYCNTTPNATLQWIVTAICCKIQ